MKLFSLEEAAEKLGVSVKELLAFHEKNVFKPAIDTEKGLYYSEEQLDNFATVLLSYKKTARTLSTNPDTESDTENTQINQNIYTRFTNWIDNEF